MELSEMLGRLAFSPPPKKKCKELRLTVARRVGGGRMFCRNRHRWSGRQKFVVPHPRILIVRVFNLGREGIADHRGHIRGPIIEVAIALQFQENRPAGRVLPGNIKAWFNWLERGPIHDVLLIEYCGMYKVLHGLAALTPVN